MTMTEQYASIIDTRYIIENDQNYDEGIDVWYSEDTHKFMDTYGDPVDLVDIFSFVKPIDIWMFVKDRKDVRLPGIFGCGVKWLYLMHIHSQI